MRMKSVLTFGSAVVVCVTTFAGCAREPVEDAAPWTIVDSSDAGSSEHVGEGVLQEDAAAPHSEKDATPSGPGGDTGAKVAGPGDASGPATACTLVVNEILTGTTGATSNEFVEVHTTCATSLAIGSWKLVYRSGTSTATADPAYDGSVLFKWPVGATIPAHGFLVYGGAGFTGAQDGPLGASLKDGSGAVAIRDAQGALVDAVGYGSGTIVTSNAFVESQAATANPVAAAPGKSIARHPDGVDTNNNQNDFSAGTPTPGAAN